MADRDPRSPDPDDWFADPDRAAPRRARPPSRRSLRSAADEDDWIDDGPRARRSGPEFVASLPERRLLIAAGAALVVILIVGWLLLRGGGSTPTQAETTTQAATTPITPTTTQAAAPTVPVPAAPLKPGDTGAQVKALQRALVQLGYAVGTIDGDYGAATKTAVEQFQTASKLTADGVFGPATRTAMIAALKTTG
jgi:Putative peptidoglycan binding domain